MDDVGGPDVLGDFDDRAGEFAVALGVVGKIAGAVAVNSVPVEIGGVVDEKVADGVEESAVGDGRKTEATAHGNGEAGHNDGGGFRAAVARENDGDFVALSGESLGQRFDDVGEAAGL